MMDYNHWAAFGFLGEILPHPENRVQLAEEKDRFGLPVAKITFGSVALVMRRLLVRLTSQTTVG
jgi:hypothetical protein